MIWSHNEVIYTKKTLRPICIYLYHALPRSKQRSTSRILNLQFCLHRFNVLTKIWIWSATKPDDWPWRNAASQFGANIDETSLLSLAFAGLKHHQKREKRHVHFKMLQRLHASAICKFSLAPPTQHHNHPSFSKNFRLGVWFVSLPASWSHPSATKPQWMGPLAWTSACNVLHKLQPLGRLDLNQPHDCCLFCFHKMLANPWSQNL